ncbi:hypothetical protein Nepgr_002431 [Nepenthes gracilis]|uniref:Uncharacterized protein n=1 Tax=Nepenthes gracilis TaxID=150966 RepID=A0AAD3P9Z3_NEPGR|nr:hypothetical protein Nepgr_002431 [Nepenthes gracilis]
MVRKITLCHTITTHGLDADECGGLTTLATILNARNDSACLITGPAACFLPANKIQEEKKKGRSSVVQSVNRNMETKGEKRRNGMRIVLEVGNLSGVCSSFLSVASICCGKVIESSG